MEDKIKVGEYVRDRDGYIIKVKDIQEYKDEDDIWYEEEILKGTWRSMVTKHSKNIIDLIEAGDYVNGYKVFHIIEDERYGKYVQVYCPSKNLKLEFIEPIFNDEIRKILTHEVYENMCYKVVE